jgi:hypothetical protein
MSLTFAWLIFKNRMYSVVGLNLSFRQYTKDLDVYQRKVPGSQRPGIMKHENSFDK